MNVFDHPNPHNFCCPICKTDADRPVVLVPKRSTVRDGIAEAEQVHAACYESVKTLIGGDWALP